MKYDKYYEARKIVKEILEKDLLGPLSYDEEITDYPLTYYVIGKIYPQECAYSVEKTSAEELGELEEEQNLAFDEGSYPSSMGMTFSLTDNCTNFVVCAKAALYIPKKNTGENTKTIWKRMEIIQEDQVVNVSDLVKLRKIKYKCHEGLSLVVYLHKIYDDGSMSVTATLINEYMQSKNDSRTWVNCHTYFQTHIEIRGNKNNFTDIRKRIKINKNDDVQEMELLYSRCNNYVTGHGCAADYRDDNGEIVLFTSFIPVYELKQMMPKQDIGSKLFSMKYLSELPKSELIHELKQWIKGYKNWIDNCVEKIKELDKEYLNIAYKNMKKCNDAYETICESINCLENNEVYKAFTYANEAMYMQRYQSLKSKEINIDVDSIRWYPFQLAFILQEIISFANPNSEGRKKVDLLWFPTGGGKTEAYLGIAAFVIFLRRMRNQENGAGVSILMRYTLRLLTFQQFERASAMICACEILRIKYDLPGGEISIGLWAGKSLTPNTIEMAGKILDGYSDPDNESSNPMQYEKCPWCGTELSRKNYACEISALRMHINCENPNCEFHKGLPVYLIDEEIYKYGPSFLVATIDKFAQVAQREQAFSLFGKGTKNLPPELIIQDELHLISGPLGTITGIYEAAFRKMCMNGKVNAKVIASTATIRNAGEQIKSLYGSEFTQFPPQGLDTNDSYFSIKSSENEKPSRMYMGCMGIGTSSTTIMVRVMAATLFATRYLEALNYDEDIIDSFWTITSYFNTLRELGGAIVRVVDNVQDRFAYLKETKFKKYYPITEGQLRYDNYIELTSREKSENIGRIIQKDLLIKYSKDKKNMPYDFILSSNMISVGIDISRLNTMLVNGQPKTTAEYIQATSRVGRETPGFVFTMYNYMRSRDKSHFEQFVQYHEAFYKYVEATSVTPFAERARDRALQTIYIMLCRFYIDELTDNKNAGRFSKSIPGLESIKRYILDYVNMVDPFELENVEEELEDIELEWETLANANPDMTYRKSIFQKGVSLFKDDFEESSRFRVLNSMRSVETTVQVIARE